MTSGTASPTPTDSPSIQRPLLSSSSTNQNITKKTVEFEEMTADGANLDDDDKDRDPESLTLRQKRGRLTQPRMSLLGRPLNYRASRRDARYRRLQSRVYNFLERPRGVAVFYHMVVFLMVFTCLILSVFQTITDYAETAADILWYMESFVVVWFAFEFGFRLWSSGCRSRYQGYMGRLKFLRRPFCIIDVITIIASIVVLVMRSGGHVVAPLRGLRFFQILRMVRMDRRGGTWKLLGSVIYAHRQELITTLYIGFLGLIFASFLVFLVEKDVENTKFSNFAQALWWGVITLCTVGYGDMVPETWQGKIIASFCALLGISFFALPAGILGSGFALKVQQQQRQKHMIRRRQPAAMLIQSLWRCYAADEHSISTATWNIHKVPEPTPPPTRSTSSFKSNSSFVKRLPTIRRHKTTATPPSPSLSTKGPTRSDRSFIDINAESAENIGLGNLNGTRTLEALNHSEDSVVDSVSTKINDDDDEPEQLPPAKQLTNQHKAAIRAIRKLKYFVARKKFREALKPYDVKDVIEQYSSGHADLLNRVKNLQFRLDQILGQQDIQEKEICSSKLTLTSRIIIVEKQVTHICTTLEKLVDMYESDRKIFELLTNFRQNKSNGNRPPSPPPPPSTILKPKPILFDKQLSEPSSPITKCGVGESSGSSSTPVRRTMHRGHSDLGNRLKKRVTLSFNSSISSNYEMPSDSGSYDGEVVIMVPALNQPQQSSEMASSSSIMIVSEVQSKELGSPRPIKQSSDVEECASKSDEVPSSQKNLIADDYENVAGADDVNETTSCSRSSCSSALVQPTSAPLSEIIITPITLSSTSTHVICSENIQLSDTNPNRNTDDV